VLKRTPRIVDRWSSDDGIAIETPRVRALRRVSIHRESPRAQLTSGLATRAAWNSGTPAREEKELKWGSWVAVGWRAGGDKGAETRDLHGGSGEEPEVAGSGELGGLRGGSSQKHGGIPGSPRSKRNRQPNNKPNKNYIGWSASRIGAGLVWLDPPTRE
jgi:hypothetical protein